MLASLFLAAGLLPAPSSTHWLCYDWRQNSVPVQSRSSAPAPENLVSTAESFLGVPYSWGGTGVGGFDCSGFVNKVYAQNGYDLPRVSREQVFVGLEVSPVALQMGDLLFFNADPGQSRITHVAMFVRDDTFIHAAQGKGEVAYDRLTERYFAERLVAARRILVLPPGRYSTLQGAAGAGVMFSSIQQVEAYLQKRASLPTPLRANRYAPMPPRTGAAPSAETYLSEHDPEARPIQLAPAYKRAVVTEVGPALLLDDATRFGLRFGGGRINNEGSLLLVPEFSYFGHENALQLDFAFPVQMRTDGSQTIGQTFDTSWNSVRDWSRIVRSATFGQKEANLFVSLGRTISQGLGDGQIMRYFTPNVASRTLPSYLIIPNALSLSTDLNFDTLGGSVFLDDLFVPRVLGLTGYVRPSAAFGWSADWVRALSVSATYVADYAAPMALAPSTGTAVVQALGVTLDAQLFSNSVHSVKSFFDVSTLVHPGRPSVGFALGAAWQAAFGATRNHAVRLRAEGRMGSPGFLPSYFDMTYALDRMATPVGDTGGTVMTKAEWLSTLQEQSGRLGFYTEASYQAHRRASIGMAYEDGRPFGGVPVPLQYPSRSLMVFAQLRNIYVGGNGRALHVHLAYDLRHFDSLTPILSMARGNEYCFAALSFDAAAAIQINGSVRKALNPGDVQSAAIDAAIDVAFHYEL